MYFFCWWYLSLLFCLYVLLYFGLGYCYGLWEENKFGCGRVGFGKIFGVLGVVVLVFVFEGWVVVEVEVVVFVVVGLIFVFFFLGVVVFVVFVFGGIVGMLRLDIVFVKRILGVIVVGMLFLGLFFFLFVIILLKVLLNFFCCVVGCIVLVFMFMKVGWVGLIFGWRKIGEGWVEVVGVVSELLGGEDDDDCVLVRVRLEVLIIDLFLGGDLRMLESLSGDLLIELVGVLLVGKG